jgi:hypothetical protein
MDDDSNSTEREKALYYDNELLYEKIDRLEYENIELRVLVKSLVDRLQTFVALSECGAIEHSRDSKDATADSDVILKRAEKFMKPHIVPNE